MIVLPTSSIMRRWVDDAFSAGGHSYRRRFTVDTAIMAARLVAAGFGCAVMHPLPAPMLPPGIVLRPFQPAITFTYALLEREEAGLGALADEFEAALRKEAQP